MRPMQAHQQGPLAGDRQHPIWTLVDTSFATHFALAPGVVFTLPLIEDSNTTFFFVVGAVVNEFPTAGNAAFAGNVEHELAGLYQRRSQEQLATGNSNSVLWSQ